MPHPVTELMLQRNSSARLSSPAPDRALLNTLFQTAFRAPDHGLLRPWRYLVIENEGLEKLGELFAASALDAEPELSQAKYDKCLKMPCRAPMVIVAIGCIKEDVKVPEVEQMLSAGVGVGYLLLSLQAEGFGGMWRTGPMAYNTKVHEALGLSASERIVGFLYVGTPEGKAKTIPTHDVDTFVKNWPN
ncbi:nitroreductase family protein [Alkalimarinus alittae]|uniref:Putative NAD(P)H nitroreductase n=1 Tax=Alkalimarinus alittae TaxID=2961619 RepID=A0ABY6N6G6_9ALTE|nr:nitroreductase [Alkalimarinus alittae]UZE97679.1 nitroreductase [Alkalimarinus alittae]